jgi:hypothetical protein
MAKKPQECPIHKGTTLVCMKCASAKGGRTRSRRHKNKLAAWGKLGGRPSKAKKETS